MLTKPEGILPRKIVTYTEMSDRVLAEQRRWTLLISVSCSIPLQPLEATISPSKAFVASRVHHAVITYRIRVSRMARRQCTLGWRVKTRGKCGGVDIWYFFSWLLYAGRGLWKFSVNFLFPIFRPHLFILHHSFLQSYRGSRTCSTIKHIRTLWTVMYLQETFIMYLQSGKGPYILALQLYTSVLYYHVVDRARVLFAHTCIVYSFYTPVLSTVLYRTMYYVPCHVIGERLGSFLYLNLNLFASKYSPIYESEVSKAAQSVAPTEDCNYVIFLT